MNELVSRYFYEYKWFADKFGQTHKFTRVKLIKWVYLDSVKDEEGGAVYRIRGLEETARSMIDDGICSEEAKGIWEMQQLAFAEILFDLEGRE